MSLSNRKFIVMFIIFLLVKRADTYSLCCVAVAYRVRGNPSILGHEARVVACLQKITSLHGIQLQERGFKQQPHVVLFFYRPVGRLSVPDLLALLEGVRGG